MYKHTKICESADGGDYGLVLSIKQVEEIFQW